MARSVPANAVAFLAFERARSALGAPCQAHLPPSTRHLDQPRLVL
jgi:hypothetical protein